MRVELIRRRCLQLDQRRIARICRPLPRPEKPAPVESQRWVAVQTMIDHDPGLRWMRLGEGEAEPSWEDLGVTIPFEEPARAVERVAPAPRMLRLPVVRELKPPPRRRWMPGESLRHQLAALGLTPKGYRPGQIAGHLSAEDERLLQAYPAPKGRDDCRPEGPGRWWGDEPCPYFRCRYHIGINVSSSGSIRLITGLEDGRGSCALDIAEQGGITLEEVGELEGRTRERTRQIEAAATRKIERAGIKLRFNEG